MEQVKMSRLQQALDVVEALPPEEQMMLFEIARRRFITQRRADLAGEIAMARRAYRQGQVRRGTADDLMAEIGA
jgi:hypothetical protein